MSINRLLVTVEATHQSLEQRLREAMEHTTTRSRPRERYARTDAFIAATSRHLAAVDDVLLGIAGDRLPDGPERVKGYLHQARLLERATAHVKARLYGELHASYDPWPEVWEHVLGELREHNRLERDLVADLADRIDREECGVLADAVYRAELRAPTRTHPYTPHRGVAGRLARRVWAVADRFWDTAEQRVVPEVHKPPRKKHAHDSLMAQYLLAEPHFEDQAPVFSHRHRED